MDVEKEGLKILVEDQKKQIHALHVELEKLSAETVALKHTLMVAQGEIRLMRQDRDYVTEEAA